ncbi:MAG TPA: helix-turn-helix domain-containing protein, partial [Terriglobia bacterium]|nr:helix-turn-helix domain-containing protein [Terriglobia bacterium]
SDIPALVHDFLARHAGDGTPTTVISSDAMACLKNYNWPGNVRELENCIQRALVLGSGPAIQTEDLPLPLVYYTGKTESAGGGFLLKEIERQAIMKALQAAEGNPVRAAKLLGIGKTTIYRKLKEYGIEKHKSLPKAA